MAQGFAQGDHICALYETEEEQLAIAARYVAEGLRRGERCLFVGRSPALIQRFRLTLGKLGVDVSNMVQQRALIEATNAEAHLAGGHFDSERMLQLLNGALEAALNDGFQGLRTCGDMSWLVDKPQGAEQVVEYEALLNQFFRGVRAAGMCLFDCNRLPSDLMDHALATHSSVVLQRGHVTNPFYEAPHIARTRLPQPDKVPWKLAELRRSL